MIASQPALAWVGSADSTHIAHGANVGQFLQPIAPPAPPPQPPATTTQNIQMGVINCHQAEGGWRSGGNCSATITFDPPFETTPHVAAWISQALLSVNFQACLMYRILYFVPRVTWVNNRQARIEMPQALHTCSAFQQTLQVMWSAGLYVHNLSN